nr:hypothetical protein [Mesorhizobium sp.]
MWSLAIGVGQSIAAVVSDCWFWSDAMPSGRRWKPCRGSLADGVGQAVATSARYSGTVFWPALRFRNAAHFASVSSSRTLLVASGVGHAEDEDALALVARADFCRREQSALNRETQLAKVSPNSFRASDVVIPRREHAADVFDEDEPRSGLDDDATGRRPEVALVEAASLLSGKGVRLARDAANEAVNAATPSAAIEGSGIAPHRRWMKETLFHR